MGNAPPPPAPQLTLLQQIAQQAGTYTGFANLLVQTLGKWASTSVSAASTSAAAAAAAAEAGRFAAPAADTIVNGNTVVVGFSGATSGPSSFATWTNNILNNPYFSKVLGAAGVVLSAYSAFTGIQGMYQTGATAGGALSILGAGAGIATGFNTFIGLHGLATITNPIGWGVGAAVIGGSIVFNGIQYMLKNGPTAATAGATAGGVALTAVGVNLVVAGLAALAPSMAAAAAAATASGVAALSAAAGSGILSTTMAAALDTATAAAATTAAAVPATFTTALLTNPAGWAAAVGVVAASFDYSAINKMVSSGITAAGMAEAVGTTLVVAAAADVAVTAALAAIAGHVFALSAAFGPVGLIVGAAVALAVVLFSVLWSLAHQPPPYVQAGIDLNNALQPIIYTAGVLGFLATGTTALFMGWHNAGQYKASASMTMPAYYLNQAVGQKNGYTLPPQGATPTLLIEPGVPAGVPGMAASPTFVSIVSPANPLNGMAMDSVQTYEVSSNLNFTSCSQDPVDSNYVPFFLIQNGTPKINPAVLTAFTNQEYLLKSITTGALTTQQSMNALTIASSADRLCMSPVSTN
jgi:hypothetical protein